MLLEVNNLAMSFDKKVLFKEASFRIFEAEKVGIVGANGAGKSTLINILGYKLIPDSGDMVFKKGIKIGFLDQYLKLDSSLTINEYLMSAFKEECQAFDEYEKNLELIKATNDYTEQMRLIKHNNRLNEYLENRDFYAMNSTIMRVASGLGINNYGMTTLLKHLSGGQKIKVILGKLILERPDLLILDEPTNFLDTIHIDWLVKYLKDFKGAVLTVSHNQEFLNDVATVIIDVDFGQITRYKGNYQRFLQKKALYLENHESKIKSLQKERTKLQTFIDKNKARASTATLAQDRAKKLERLEKVEDLKTKAVKIYLNFKYKPISSQRFLVVNDLEIGYGFSLLPKISFEIRSGEKLAITGFNGIGKSTLLKTLIGELEPIKGNFKFVDDALISYFAQEPFFACLDQTPIDEIRNDHPLMTDREIRSELAKCGLTGALPLQSIKTLSGGERSKLNLCKMTLIKANVLILDEPTNHLDSLAKECLLDALRKYQGTIIIVSHEREFIEQLASKVYSIEKLLID